MAHHNPGFEAIVDSVRGGVVECTVQEVKDQLDHGARLMFIDIREDHEVAVGSAAGSVHLGRGILERDVETLEPDKQAAIVLYCGGGYRSALAADSLKKMGYTNVKSMAGGIRAWREAALPIDNSPKP